MEVPLESIAELAADEPHPADEVRRDQARPIIYGALRHLSERERDALVLWAVMGHGLGETAEAIGVSGPTLHSILARAMSKLRRVPEMRALLMDWMAED